jgi:putative hydrolase of the HAD superfamily
MADKEDDRREKEMIKTIVCDKGNVLTFFDHSIMFSELSRHTHYSSEEIGKLLPYSDLDEDFHEGKITPKEFYAGVCRMLELNIPFREFRKIYTGMYTGENRKLLNFLRSVKGRYKIMMLSDSNELHAEYSFRKFPFWDVFDEVIMSHMIHYSKSRHPKKAFGIAVEKAGCAPEECVFVDDREEYIESARRFGMHGILFTGNEDLFVEFRKLGIVS